MSKKNKDKQMVVKKRRGKPSLKKTQKTSLDLIPDDDDLDEILGLN